MISTNEFINLMAEDVQKCKHFAENHWLTATPEELSWIDPHFGWSVDFIMKHLAAFATHYLLPIETEIKLAKEKGAVSKETFTSMPEVAELLKNLSYEGIEQMIQFGHFAQIELHVAEGYNVEKATFIHIQDEILRLLEQARAVNLETILIPSLIKEGAFFSLGDCFQFLIRHQILHFAQAEIIMRLYMQMKQASQPESA